MTSNINIQGTTPVDDPEYRYKMPPIIGKVEGRGNGIKTALPNMTTLAFSLHRDPAEVTKFFGTELGAQTTWNPETERAIVNGAHTTKDLQTNVFKYVEKFVLCPACRLPETVYKFKAGVIFHSCSACGAKEMLDMSHKLTVFILKQHATAKKAKDKDKKAEKKDKKKKKGDADDDADDDGKEKKKKKKVSRPSSKRLRFVRVLSIASLTPHPRMHPPTHHRRTRRRKRPRKRRRPRSPSPRTRRTKTGRTRTTTATPRMKAAAATTTATATTTVLPRRRSRRPRRPRRKRAATMMTWRTALTA